MHGAGARIRGLLSAPCFCVCLVHLCLWFLPEKRLADAAHLVVCCPAGVQVFVFRFPVCGLLCWTACLREAVSVCLGW